MDQKGRYGQASIQRNQRFRFIGSQISANSRAASSHTIEAVLVPIPAQRINLLFCESLHIGASSTIARSAIHIFHLARCDQTTLVPQAGASV